MNVIGTAQEYKSPAVCLLHMEKSTVDIFTILSHENITMNVKYVRYLDGVSCRLRRPDHNSRYKKYVDGMLVCCTSVRM